MTDEKKRKIQIGIAVAAFALAGVIFAINSDVFSGPTSLSTLPPMDAQEAVDDADAGDESADEEFVTEIPNMDRLRLHGNQTSMGVGNVEGDSPEEEEYEVPDAPR